MTSLMVRASTSGSTRGPLRANGKMVKCTEMVSLLGQMAEFIRAIIRMIGKTTMGFYFWLMGVSMRVIG